MQAIQQDNIMVIDKITIQQIFLNRMKALLGTELETIDFDGQTLYPNSLNLSSLDEPFTE